MVVMQTVVIVILYCDIRLVETSFCCLIMKKLFPLWCINWLVVYVVQIILAFGNYVNSAKRGSAYGFKLQSLDMVVVV